MPEVTIEIGGRQFEVACQDGEEHYLRSAEKLLDAEASVLQEQIGRMPEPRMLLMSALMLADKTAALQEKLTDAETLLADTRVELEQLKNAPAPEAAAPAPVARRRPRLQSCVLCCALHAARCVRAARCVLCVASVLCVACCAARCVLRVACCVREEPSLRRSRKEWVAYSFDRFIAAIKTRYTPHARRHVLSHPTTGKTLS